MLRRRAIDGRGRDIRAHNHARAAARRRVVDRAMLVVGEIADVEGRQAPQAILKRAPGQAEAERPRKHLGKQRQHNRSPGAHG